MHKIRFVLTKRDLYLMSAGFMLSAFAQRLLRISWGFLPRVGLWKTSVWRRSGKPKKPLDFYHTAKSTFRKAAVTFAGSVSRKEVDKVICAQYEVFTAEDGEMHDDILCEGSSARRNNFCERIGILAERYCPALRDFTGESGDTTALEVGCLAGGVSFELARSFQAVFGCDESKECITIADAMKKRGWIRYRILREADIYEEKTATIDASIDRERVSFARIKFKDIYTPYNLFKPENPFDCVVSLCLTRLSDPMMFLKRLVDFVAPNGICVLGSSFDWSEGTTPKDKWLGGYIDRDGRLISNMHTIRSLMESNFTLVHVEDLPLSIRESSRQEFVMTYSISVWKRRR